ncbi:hypothetical protein [Amycolatopsis pigmentata]|uniref:DUF3558 domain-containing protein n=1 Tax=Amycolatopsis pigmentata TaxID=450801 RepID=A0ABW5FV70_9PSEU
MDERELGTLFREAPGEPPPPTFDLTDVTTASARATARRRSALILAAGCVVLVLVGLGLTRFGFTGTTTSGAPQVTTGGPPAGRPAPPSDASTPSPLQGSGGTGEAGPRAEGTSGCEKVDRELATALAGELPVTGAVDASPDPACPAGARSAGFRISDGDRRGFLSVTLVPSGAVPPPAAGVASIRKETPSGATLVVSSAPDPGSAPPWENHLESIVRDLAPRF